MKRHPFPDLRSQSEFDAIARRDARDQIIVRVTSRCLIALGCAVVVTIAMTFLAG